MPMERTTVRVKILVGIDDRAQWIAAGYNYHGETNHPRHWLDTDQLEPMVRYYWVEADLPYNQELPALSGRVTYADRAA